MWQVAVFCSGCTEESEVVVQSLDDVEREVCECGYGFVTLSVATFEPARANGARLAAFSA
jgi:hypothetical protein